MKKIILFTVLTTLLASCNAGKTDKDLLKQNLNQPIDTKNEVPPQNF